MKKKYIGIAICAIAISLPVLVVCASPAWDINNLISYMENVGRHKIYQTNWILYNEIGPKMGQGLVGEYKDWNEIGQYNFPAGETIIFGPWDPGHPKKFSLWIETDLMPAGTSVIIRVYYDANGAGTAELYHYRTLSAEGAQGQVCWLVEDQLPISALIRVTLEPSVANTLDVHGSVIIEEV